MTLVIQVSDTHLRVGDALAEESWRAVAGWIARRRPAIVLHSGDIVGGAVDDEADHAHAAALLRALPCPVRAIPGNHDVGDGPPRPPAVTPERIARFERHHGPAGWVEEVGGWRLVGCDAMRLGTGLDEAPVWTAVEAALAAAPRALLLLHKAPFLLDPLEDGETSATLPAPGRARLARMLEGWRGVVACGYRHEFRIFHRGGMTAVWAPATLPAPAEVSPPRAPLPPAPGLVEYELHGDTAIIRAVPLEAMRLALG